MEVIWHTILLMGGIGVLAAAVLYFVARKFYVHEDERIGEIEALLPGANCGACGYKGCHDFACACASATSLDGVYCPSSGSDGMARIAEVIGLKATGAVTKRAVPMCVATMECDVAPSRPLSARESPTAPLDVWGVATVWRLVPMTPCT